MLQLALPGPVQRQSVFVKQVEVDGILALLHKQGDRQLMEGGQSRPLHRAGEGVGEYLSPSGSDPYRRRPGQHPGPGGGGAAQPHLTFGPQNAAQHEQRLRSHVLPQDAPDDSVVPEAQHPLLAPAGDGPGQAAGGGGGLARPEPDPLQQGAALLRQGVFPKDGPLVEDRPLPGGGIPA